MDKTMGRFSRALAVAIAGLLLLSSGPTAEAQRGRIVIVRPAPFWGWGPSPYWYPYGPYYGFPSDYISANYGYVKIDAHHRDKDASVFVDDGYASKVKNNIELRDSDGRTIFQERVAVMVGRTTKVDVPS